MAFTDDPDPYALQGVFAMLMALDFTVRALAGDVMTTTSYAGSALILTLAISGAAALVPWPRLPYWAVAALPVLDMGAISLSRVDEAGAATGVLVVVPGFWLGRLLGRQGAVVALIAGMAVITIPGLFNMGLSGANLSRSIMLVLVCAWVAFAIGANLEQVRREKEETQRHGEERDRALEVVDHQRRISDAILDSVDVGLVLLDREGNYQAMNRRHEEFMRLAFPFGHEGRAGQLGKVYGEDGQHLLAREEMPTYRAMHGEEFDDCRIWVGDDRLTWRALSVSARSVRDDKGEFAGAALAYNDVTDFMRALKVKDEFIASVSHELRTPLTSIRGYADLLLDRGDLPDDVVQQLSVVVRNTDRLGRLVADLLHTAQIELGPMEVVRSRGDLADIVKDAVDSAVPTAHASGISLNYNGPRRMPMRMDQNRMRQVVDNLISNALKYTPPGGRVEVRLNVDGDRVELEVSDSGIGIEAADRDRLFTRFFRSRHAAEQSIQGVGLGLSITKSIVESHGGRIEVESEVGRGSTFRVRVPVEG